MSASKKRNSLLLRGIPPGLRAALERSARKNRRSLNAEILTWLEERKAKP